MLDSNSTIAVSYLANDENMIVPYIVMVIGYYLRAKIKNNIDPDDLLEGERAIILWLRATGYGTKYIT